MISIEEILRIYNTGKGMQNLVGGCEVESQFSLDDLIGETISGKREVYRSEDNPDILDVLDFRSGRALIIGVEGWEDGTTHHCYLAESDGKARYSSDLFEADIRHIGEDIK